MPGTIINDGENVSGGIFSPPTGWALEPHHRYLKGTLKGLQGSGQEDKGATQADLDAAEDFAWRMILARLAHQYDISDWSNNPPYPLFEIWDLLGSSMALAAISQRKNINDQQVKATWELWSDKACEMLESITDPRREGLRMNLLDEDGNVLAKRSNVAMPVIRNPRGVVFFPSVPNFDYQVPGSIKQFLDDHFSGYNILAR